MAMSTGGGSDGMMSDINVTPMVDVMLVLLIIFMVAAPMIQTGVDVTLPQAKAQTMPDDEGKLVMTVNKEQKIFLGRTQVADCPASPRPLTPAEFIIKGGAPDSAAGVKNGELTYYHENMTDVSGTVSFEKLGLFKLTQSKAEAHQDAIRTVKADMFMESCTVKIT